MVRVLCGRDIRPRGGCCQVFMGFGDFFLDIIGLVGVWLYEISFIGLLHFGLIKRSKRYEEEAEKTFLFLVSSGFLFHTHFSS